MPGLTGTLEVDKEVVNLVIGFATLRTINFILMLLPWLILPMQNNAKTWEITVTLAYGYTSESTQWKLSNEYQHAWLSLDGFCIFVLWAKVALALEGLIHTCLVFSLKSIVWIVGTYDKNIIHRICELFKGVGWVLMNIAILL